MIGRCGFSFAAGSVPGFGTYILAECQATRLLHHMAGTCRMHSSSMVPKPENCGARARHSTSLIEITCHPCQPKQQLTLQLHTHIPCSCVVHIPPGLACVGEIDLSQDEPVGVRVEGPWRQRHSVNLRHHHTLPVVKPCAHEHTCERRDASTWHLFF